ncbi:hypothetical protein V2T44_12020 [Serratia ficaria]|uniref:hypothetical protein n=2 Tax=Serratia TaxID=613 RepID=UPI0012EE2028|nr:hypothetical protein [Serratia ficaria]MEE4483670.1 hypothetical protein [Serratia ficaria]
MLTILILRTVSLNNAEFYRLKMARRALRVNVFQYPPCGFRAGLPFDHTAPRVDS